jgi:DNA mismatch repair ATPase MutL
LFILENVDPNLTPDKRQVFLRIEKETFAKLRACLLETFQAVVSKCPVSNTVQDKQQELKLKHKSTESKRFLLRIY